MEVSSKERLQGHGRKMGYVSFQGGRQAGVGEIFTSIFFSEIPDCTKAKDIFELFGCHGDVVEVVIPPKLNFRGKRYGFARFSEVEDARMLGVRLDHIVIDRKKMHANIPRYERKRREAL